MKLTVVGITGKMGSGKTTLADNLVQKKRYEKMSFANPIYRISHLVACQLQNEEDNSITYALYDQILDLFGGYNSAPKFNVVAGLANSGLKNLAEKTDMHGDLSNGSKPRKFLQSTGDYFRNISGNIFASYLRRRILKKVRDAKEEYFQSLDGVATPINTVNPAISNSNGSLKVTEPNIKIVIDDLRFNEEAEELINSVRQASELYGFLSEVFIINLDLPIDQAAKRVALRDGLDEEVVKSNMNHASENGIENKYIGNEINTEKPIEDVYYESLRIINKKPQEGSSELTELDKAIEDFDITAEQNIINLSELKEGKKNG